MESVQRTPQNFSLLGNEIKPASLPCCRSREIAADRASQCSAQREGKPFADLERIVEDVLALVTAGTIQSNAQSVIIVVREDSAPAIEGRQR